MSSPESVDRRQDERLLRLDFQCLESMPGGINEVRLWWDDLLGCHRVGKRMDVSGLEHEEVLPEPATLQMIRHDNVVPVVAAARVDGYPAPMRVVELVTPYFPRGSVTDALLKGETFLPSEAVAVVQATLRGLAELHEVHGIAHRDMKSGNILLADDHTVAKVADLGLAGRFDQHGKVPAVNNPTLYSPPELISTGQLSRASDLFPLGLVLTELLAGPFPYASYTTSGIAQRLLGGRSPLSSKDVQLPVWTPRPLRRIINKATQRDVSARYQSAREMDTALAAAVIVDWSQVETNAWEAPFTHRRGCRIRVDAHPKRSGEVSIAIRINRGRGWRRDATDVLVASVRSAQAQRVFDQATEMASAR